MALHTLGRQAESDAALNTLIDEHANLYAYQIAEVYAWRNESDQAFNWLEQARGQRSTWMWYVLRTNFFTNLENDPRWDAFLETIGLSSAQRAALELQDKASE